MPDVLRQLRELRTPEVSSALTERVLDRTTRMLAAQARSTASRSVKVFGWLVAAISLAHAVWTTVFINTLAR